MSQGSEVSTGPRPDLDTGVDENTIYDPAEWDEVFGEEHEERAAEQTITACCTMGE